MNKAKSGSDSGNKSEQTVVVPVSLIEGLIRTIQMDLKFQPGLAIRPWLNKLYAVLSQAKKG